MEHDHRPSDRHRRGKKERQKKEIEAERQKYRQKERHKYIRAERQKEKWTDLQTDGQAERHKKRKSLKKDNVLLYWGIAHDHHQHMNICPEVHISQTRGGETA